MSSITSSHESHTVTSAKLYQSDRAALISGERTEHEHEYLDGDGLPRAGCENLNLYPGAVLNHD